MNRTRSFSYRESNAWLFTCMAVFVSGWVTAALIEQTIDGLKVTFLTPAALLLAVAAWLSYTRRLPALILTAYVLAGAFVIGRAFASGVPLLGVALAAAWSALLYHWVRHDSIGFGPIK